MRRHAGQFGKAVCANCYLDIQRVGTPSPVSSWSYHPPPLSLTILLSFTPHALSYKLTHFHLHSTFSV